MKQGVLGCGAIGGREGLAGARRGRARRRYIPSPRSFQPGRFKVHQVAEEGRRAAGKVLIDRALQAMQPKREGVAGLNPGTLGSRVAGVLRQRRKGDLSKRSVIPLASQQPCGTEGRCGRCPA